MLFTTVGTLLALLVGYIIWVRGSLEPVKLFGIYSQPTRSYPLKCLAFYALVHFRRFMGLIWSFQKEDAGYGQKSYSKEEDMECPQNLSLHPKAIDAVYFNSANSSGDYFVIATARRPKGVINGFCFLRIPEVGLLESPKLPDTMIFGDDLAFKGEGISIKCIEPMQSWKLSYDGVMK